MDAGDLAHRRDRLLAIAVDVVAGARRDGTDPGSIAPALHAGWRAAGDPNVVFDEDFWSDPGTGVEALAFAVGLDPATSRGGLVLRLRGELPDSFEAVDPPPTALPALAALRKAYFATST